MKTEKKIFNNDGHITDMYTCICSDLLREEKEYQIPDKVRCHLEDCETCRSSVLDIYSTTLTSEEHIRPEFTLFSDSKQTKKDFTYRLALRTAATFLILGFITAVFLLIDNKEPIHKRLADRK